VNTAYQFYLEKLQTIYALDEAQAITNQVFEEVLMVKPHQIKMLNKPLSDGEEANLMDILNRLLKHEPMQYILGNAWFYGNKFIVTPDTLIPRSETEELVELILNTVANDKVFDNSNPKIIDIGTGSGCIAISLKLNLPHADVWALDKSSAALAIAKQNVKELNAQIQFIGDDILYINQAETAQFFDIIVSNPPYILENEQENMHENVLAFEPHQALFVANNKPLLFYEAIANYALKYLKPNGYLFFEINQQFGNQTVNMLQEKGFLDIKLFQDINGNDRMVMARNGDSY
jgi:release factor glutamine methyltransferase